MSKSLDFVKNNLCKDVSDHTELLIGSLVSEEVEASHVGLDRCALQTNLIIINSSEVNVLYFWPKTFKTTQTKNSIHESLL